MDNVLLARGQMAMSLAFHIVFAAVGVAMPLLMCLAELRWLRTGDRDSLDLAHRWEKGTAVLFAVGAVSGTVLSFELGLLFPGFMRHAGAVIGMPFSLEGFAFFTEAIFLGLYLYGWDRLSPRTHLFAGVVVALSGLASAAFVTIANAWMNAPRGFRVEGGHLVDIDPIAAMGTPFAAHEIVHGTLAAYLATGAAVAAIHAAALLRGPESSLHRLALGLALRLTVPCALLVPLTGHWAGHEVAALQPAKLAAIEQLQHTQRRAPLTVGPIRVPGALSVLAGNSLDTEVKGLDAFPPDERPPSAVRAFFWIMVASGLLLAGNALWGLLLRIRGRPHPRAFLWTTALVGPLGFVAVEAGWTVTELGRQPWVIYGVLRTADSVTPMPWLAGPFAAIAAVYLVLSAVVAGILRREIREAR